MELSSLFSMPLEQMFRGFFLPFLILFAVVFGVLSTVRIFNKKINLVISLALTVLVVFTPQFTVFANYLAQLGGQFAIVAFFAVFGFGVLMWALGRGWGIFQEQTGLSKDRIIKKLEKHYRKYKEAQESGDRERMGAEEDEIRRLERELKLAED